MAPKIDGRIDEVGWQDGISGFIPPRRRSAAAESTTFLYLHDEGNLYIAARCHESVMDSLSAHASQRDGLVHADDCVGFFLQPDPAVPTVYQVYFNSMGEVFDQSIVWEDVWYEASRNWDGEYEVATRREADRWSIEIRIPLAQFGAKTESGAAMGLNFRRKQPRLNTSADWMPIDYDPRTLGVLRFE